MKYLGIDYGSKRTGGAISDGSGKIAFPKFVLPTDARLGQKIRDLCVSEKVDAIVIGQSLNFKGAPNPIQAEIENWKLKIENSLSIPVIYEAEHLTSTQASRSTDKANIDSAAAALILQSYLDRQNRL